jgi:hypothetical protein
MTTVLPVQETLDAISSFIVPAGAAILLLAAATFFSMLAFESVHTFRTFQTLSKLT